MNTENTIIEKLTQEFQPDVLFVENESHTHNVPANSETHFKVTLVTDLFEGKRLLQRHRQVNTLLKNELAGGVHALALHTYTCKEWQAKQESPASPGCMGGSKK